ncbi:carboxypeptidase M32 [Desulfoprunum benzoelyticum]|uniref:Metal-dependent carboxypeptidase n=1 Tax=Desulfoprunum benzoelyticum TaxID=1506996 RepID=A0A840V5S1_9BACT|nr:carboxypeptidase M32 [Desulfoprunum benzoelyticum]MBB5349260.1 carboxypeptidase Taq [Desulfoprunum benzoelyticum]MBM9530992.1 carboxypeptidase M32 [Desulfoprunum benzoelyticum]
MQDAYGALVERFRQLARIDHALTFLNWDQLVMMPPAGNDSRAAAIAELTAMQHELLTAPVVGDLLQAARTQALAAPEQCSLREMERQWQRAVCLPASLVKAQSLAGSQCEHAWRQQRRDNDWQGFVANFREVVRLSREEARLRQAVAADMFATPYDALLDLYCTGDDSAFIGQVFATLKAELPTLLAEVLERRQPAPSLAGTYPPAAQKTLSEEMMRCLGFDFSAGRLDVSMHPFSTGDRGDHRITTGFREDDFAGALQATAHETGHAGYEAGLPRQWDGLPVGQARNLCLHESQSLLFENQLFLARPFVAFLTPMIHKHLVESRHFSEEQLWRALTRVGPSLIRIEADEVTYPLHVVLRFEIEKALINAEIEPDDIPELWDLKMRQYLGLSTAGNFRDGCLQDIHWTDGSFGYFPSYTMGALNAAQLFAAIRRHFPDWREALARGDVAFVRQWLGEQVWSKGSTMESQDIMRQATGEGTNPGYFLDHLRARYLHQQY